MGNPRSCHLLAIKRILKYIKCAADHGILMSYRKNTRRGTNAHDYSDSYQGGDQDNMKSTTIYLLMSRETIISMSTEKQGIMALSSCETQYVAMQFVKHYGWEFVGRIVI